MSDSLDCRVQCRKNNISSQLTTRAAISGGDCASERVQEGKEGRGGGEKGEGNRLELFIVSVSGSEIDSFSFLKF